MQRPSMLRILAGFAAAFVAFFVVNLIHFVFGCIDCDYALGLPFTFEREGGWVSDRRIIWPGAIADFIFYFGLGLLFVWLLNRDKKLTDRSAQTLPAHGPDVNA